MLIIETKFNMGLSSEQKYIKNDINDSLIDFFYFLTTDSFSALLLRQFTSVHSIEVFISRSLSAYFDMR